jgi:hypothetical protein
LLILAGQGCGVTNVLALNRVLSAIGIRSDRLAEITGTVADNKLALLVPPAGWLGAAASATGMLAFALVEAGRDRPEATSIEAEMADTLLAGLPDLTSSREGREGRPDGQQTKSHSGGSDIRTHARSFLSRWAKNGHF